MQSVPRSHVLPSEFLPPSWQCVLLANCSPPLLKGERHVFSQMAGGGGDGRDGGGGGDAQHARLQQPAPEAVLQF